jgi:hypothetical protein
LIGASGDIAFKQRRRNRHMFVEVRQLMSFAITNLIYTLGLLVGMLFCWRSVGVSVCGEWLWIQRVRGRVLERSRIM